ncbi:MAG: hypothetical protein K8S98_18065 [Planctomycetes bacterium]|nr:hypothetical protein [Planctomycetota bacterium]
MPFLWAKVEEVTKTRACGTLALLAIGACIAGIVFCNWSGCDSSAVTTTWAFAPIVVSPDGRFVAGRVVESDPHDTRQALGVAELLGRPGEAVWFSVYPFDAVTWRSLGWESNTRLVVEGRDLTGGRIGHLTHLKEWGLDVVLVEAASARPK